MNAHSWIISLSGRTPKEIAAGTPFVKIVVLEEHHLDDDRLRSIESTLTHTPFDRTDSSNISINGHQIDQALRGQLECKPVHSFLAHKTTQKFQIHRKHKLGNRRKLRQ